MAPKRPPPEADGRIVRTRKKRAPGPGKAHFRVLARIGTGMSVREGSITIDRKTRWITVRGHRLHKAWSLPLDLVAELVMARAAKLEAEERLGTRGR
jgi:hypothetical protein